MACKRVRFVQYPLAFITHLSRETVATERWKKGHWTEYELEQHLLETCSLKIWIALVSNVIERLCFVFESHRRKTLCCIGRTMPEWCIVQYNTAGMLQDLGTMVMHVIITVMIPHTQFSWCRCSPLIWHRSGERAFSTMLMVHAVRNTLFQIELKIQLIPPRFEERVMNNNRGQEYKISRAQILHRSSSPHWWHHAVVLREVQIFLYVPLWV